MQTAKMGSEPNAAIIDDGVAFRIERDRADGLPITCLATPPGWVAITGLPVYVMACSQDGPIFTGAALRGFIAQRP